MKQNLLSVIVPCRNQGRELNRTLRGINSHASKIPYGLEIVYVDSASTDNSFKIAKNHLRKMPGLKVASLSQPGKGRAVKKGMAIAKGDFKIFMDADNSTPFSQVDKLLPFIERYDIVIGSRYVKEPTEPRTDWFGASRSAFGDVVDVLVKGSAGRYTAQIKQSRWRQFVARGGNLAFTVLLGQCFADTRCGFKLFKKEVADQIFPLTTLPGFGFDTEIFAIAKERGFSVIEVPVDWYDEAGDANVSLADTFKSFGEILKIRWNLFRGLYGKDRLVIPEESPSKSTNF